MHPHRATKAIEVIPRTCRPGPQPFGTTIFTAIMYIESLVKSCATWNARRSSSSFMVGLVSGKARAGYVPTGTRRKVETRSVLPCVSGERDVNTRRFTGRPTP